MATIQKLDTDFSLIDLNEIIFKQPLSTEKEFQLKSFLKKYNIEIIENQKIDLVQKIKDTIVDMIWKDDNLPNITTSIYLADKLHHSYGYLSNLFSEVTYTSIENFVILQKIERAKQMIASDNYTLSEISYQLNYSSVAHLSTQFKKTIGITPSAFQRIIKARRKNRADS